jgi:hypothetical protein
MKRDEVNDRWSFGDVVEMYSIGGVWDGWHNRKALLCALVEIV